jgi:ketosteroid isomerase-like protein
MAANKSKRSILAFILLCLVHMGCAQSGRRPSNFTNAEMEAVVEARRACVLAIQQGDWDAWAQAHTEDALLVLPNEPLVSGRQQIKFRADSLPAHADFSLLPVRMDGSDDIAYIWGTFGVKAAQNQEGMHQVHGAFVQVWRKDEKGRWLIAVDSYSSSSPINE